MHPEMTNPPLVLSSSFPSRSKWRRNSKTLTRSRWPDCTLNTRPNATCWKTWGTNVPYPQSSSAAKWFDLRRARERRTRSLTGELALGRERKGISCSLLFLSSILFGLWVFGIFSLLILISLGAWPPSRQRSCVSFSFRLSCVYSGHARVRQISLLALAVVGNPDSSAASHFLCWLKIDYSWESVCKTPAARPSSVFPSISHLLHFIYLLTQSRPSRQT